MKKIAFALLALTASTSAFATDPCASAALDFSTPGTEATYDAVNASCTVDVTGDSATVSTFVVNDFDFTVSANVAVSAVQNEQSMAVAAGSTKGRNVFTGHSNGGSVSQCNTAPITDATANPATLTDDELNIANTDGCNNKPAI